MRTTRWVFFEGLFSASLSFLSVSFPRAPLQVIDGERTARLIRKERLIKQTSNCRFMFTVMDYLRRVKAIFHTR